MYITRGPLHNTGGSVAVGVNVGVGEGVCVGVEVEVKSMAGVVVGKLVISETPQLIKPGKSIKQPSQNIVRLNGSRDEYVKVIMLHYLYYVPDGTSCSRE